MWCWLVVEVAQGCRRACRKAKSWRTKSLEQKGKRTENTTKTEPLAGATGKKINDKTALSVAASEENPSKN